MQSQCAGHLSFIFLSLILSLLWRPLCAGLQTEKLPTEKREEDLAFRVNHLGFIFLSLIFLSFPP